LEVARKFWKNSGNPLRCILNNIEGQIQNLFFYTPIDVLDEVYPPKFGFLLERL
jgi:hypothetical protein